MVEDEASPAEQQHQRDAIMQRVRVGLTGLAAVFLLTLLAASIFSLLGQDEQQRGVRLANGAVANNMTAGEELPKEPLAELGVAPGGNVPKAVPVQPQAQPAPAQPQARAPSAQGPAMHPAATPATKG